MSSSRIECFSNLVNDALVHHAYDLARLLIGVTKWSNADSTYVALWLSIAAARVMDEFELWLHPLGDQGEEVVVLDLTCFEKVATVTLIALAMRNERQGWPQVSMSGFCYFILFFFMKSVETFY